MQKERKHIDFILKGVKIYAMIGIPTESNEDIQDTINLAKKLRKLNKGFDISFAFSSAASY